MFRILRNRSTSGNVERRTAGTTREGNDEYPSPALAALLPCLPLPGHATDWTMTDHVAWSTAIETSDGTEARLVARCRSDLRTFVGIFSLPDVGSAA